MNVLWPLVLLFLLIVPLLIALYVWMLRRKRRFAVRYSNVALIRAALPKRSQWRRHIPFALLMVAVTSLITAMARPVAQVQVPLSKASILLAIDVSRSMCATDVPPNRLTVAQDAMNSFINDQAESTRIGIVAFTGYAQILVPPTNDKDQLHAAVDGFTTAIGTAMGSAILKSIDSIAETNDAVLPSGVDLSAAEDGSEESLLSQLDVAETGYEPDIIVVLTDGASTRGIDPMVAAQQAADRKLRIYTIGFGTQDPGQMVCTRAQLGSDVFGPGSGNFGGGDRGGGFGNFGGGGGAGGFRRYLLLDEPTLRGVADMTGGEYFLAEDADQLLDVFLNLPNHVEMQTENREVSVIFTALGALLSTLAVGLSLLWNRFPFAG